MEKFFAKRTVETAKAENHEKLRFPSVAICPGFKKDERGIYHVIGMEMGSEYSYLHN